MSHLRKNIRTIIFEALNTFNYHDLVSSGLDAPEKIHPKTKQRIDDIIGLLKKNPNGIGVAAIRKFVGAFSSKDINIALFWIIKNGYAVANRTSGHKGSQGTRTILVPTEKTLVDDNTEEISPWGNEWNNDELGFSPISMSSDPTGPEGYEKILKTKESYKKIVYAIDFSENEKYITAIIEIPTETIAQLILSKEIDDISHIFDMANIYLKKDQYTVKSVIFDTPEEAKQKAHSLV